MSGDRFIRTGEEKWTTTTPFARPLPEWRISAKGNPYARLDDGRIVMVARVKGGAYTYAIKPRESDDWQRGTLFYKTLDEAKHGVLQAAGLVRARDVAEMKQSEVASFVPDPPLSSDEPDRPRRIRL